ncbi:---NA--- [Paramuricea clavata]|nr:---NA--- [Paramuricea clavata]
MGGNKIENVADPTTSQSVVTKSWFNLNEGTFLRLDGTGSLNVAGTVSFRNTPTCSQGPTTSNHLVNLAYLNSLLGSLVKIDGSLRMTGNLQMGGNEIVNVGAPSADGSAVNKKWVEDPAKITTTSHPLKTTERTRTLQGITTLPLKNPTVKNTGPMVNKLVFSLVIASIAVVILAILFVLCRKKTVIPDRKSNKTPEGAPHYISYNASNKGEALDIARWLQEKNINVIIDQLSYIKPNRRAWSERQLLEAEKIIMIVTPKYLGICNLQQTKSNEEKKSSHNDELVCNEIALIKNKLIENGMAADKCIVILIDTKRKDLPHWMSQFNCYQYKNGKLDEDILPMLKPVASLNTLL